MKSPVIVFDLGKVLVDFDYSIAARQGCRAQHAIAAQNLDCLFQQLAGDGPI